METYTITHNTQYNSIEIKFTGVPSAAVREALKTLKFRWHNVKKVWYGFTTEAEAIKAIDAGNARKNEAKKSNKPKTVKASGTPQDHIKIYYNGIKVDGELKRCWYSINGDTITIYARDYSCLPRDVLPVVNESDIMTDYFEEDRATINKDHPLYKYFRYVALKAETKNKYRAPSPYYVEEFNTLSDPGQPSAEVLEEIKRQREKAEAEQKEKEALLQEKERAEHDKEKTAGEKLIEEEMQKHPITDGNPIVIINWSEHPSFYKWDDDELKLSVTAAENILKTLDEERHNSRIGGYDKTSFTIEAKDENGETISYKGRYDLGDNDGGLIKHIEAVGEWYRTHTEFGAIKENPDPENPSKEWLDILNKALETA